MLLVVDAETGEVKQKLLHDEFGNILLDTNKDLTPFGFAGGIYDSETGLVRFGARDYDPRVGRWTSKDPISFDGGDSNLYGYVLQDPINYLDSDGHFAIPLFLPAIIPVIIDAALITGSILGSSYLVEKLVNAYSKGGRQNVKDSGLASLSDSEISRRARDKSLPPSERLRYSKEEKARGLRNKKKRECN